MARSELERWKADNPHANADPADFALLREALCRVTLTAIMAGCQVSKTTASGWRSGRHVPALRHWPVLANLSGVDTADLIDHQSPSLPQPLASLEVSQ
jgi:hypothetical protein